MQAEEVFLTFSAMVIVAGFLIVVLGLRHRTKMLEMAHRERLALIERGLAPAPETNPARFYGHYARRNAGPRAQRSLAVGILIIGFGLGLAVLMAFAAGEPRVGAGIGGAIAVLGGAFVVTSLVARREEQLVPTVEPPVRGRAAESHAGPGAPRDPTE